MPRVVLDTSVSLPATLSPGGMARKFWVLLALGALTHRVEHHHFVLDEMRREGEFTGAKPGALHVIATEAGAAERRRAALCNLLPHDAPQHWIALGGSAIFDEYEHKVGEIGKRLNPAMRDTDIPSLRRQVEAVCIADTPPFDPDDAPPLTRDRKDDPIVYTALVGHADYIISDDRDIVPDGREHEYRDKQHRVLAVTFNRFISAYFEPDDLNWGAIDGRWLRHAFDDPHKRV